MHFLYVFVHTAISLYLYPKFQYPLKNKRSDSCVCIHGYVFKDYKISYHHAAIVNDNFFICDLRVLFCNLSTALQCKRRN